jgi:hypothetical protein
VVLAVLSIRVADPALFAHLNNRLHS